MKFTRRGFVACLCGLAGALLAPMRLLTGAKAAQIAQEEQPLPQVQPFRALVNGEMFSLSSFADLPAGRADLLRRAALSDAAGCRFGGEQQGLAWRQLHFVERVRRGNATIPSYVWA